MKRIALIIGSAGLPEEFLLGVKVDVENYQNFLLSPVGGLWYKEEIIVLLDEDVDEVYEVIEKIKDDKPHFAFVVFTGHGYYDNEEGERVLMLEDGELCESDLRGLAPRELLIIDTCAGMEEEIYKEEAVEGLIKTAELINYRKIYEDAIKGCLPQEIILYASSPGEYSEDTPRGGLFSKTLLEVAYNNNKFKILSALMAWKLAAENVKKLSNGRQNPDYLATVRFGKKLPFSLSLPFSIMDMG